MNPFEMLREDHRSATHIIHTLKNGGSEDERRALFDKLHKELEVHTRIEEDYFYPAVRQATGEDALVDDGREEHDQIRECLSAMQSQSVGAEEWKQTLDRLEGIVRHHVSDEENEMFPKAEAKVSDADLQRLAKDLERDKQELMRKMA